MKKLNKEELNKYSDTFNENIKEHYYTNISAIPSILDSWKFFFLIEHRPEDLNYILEKNKNNYGKIVKKQIERHIKDLNKEIY